MGCGTWEKESFVSYSTSKGVSVDSLGTIISNLSNQDMFKARCLDDSLNPKNVIRECCDSEEHPNTVPVILALDVTGSMGQSAVEVAKKLNVIMEKLYKDVEDIEFMIMGIGDVAYDQYPIQASQFESDIRIAEQLDKVYFEFGGGGNNFESYTAAWYFGLHHTNLDCWKRGKRGIIITIGDEYLNPYLPLKGLYSNFTDVTGDNLQEDVETTKLFEDASQKFDIYHLDVDHGFSYNSDRKENIKRSFEEVIEQGHFYRVNMNEITDKIVEIIVNASKDDEVFTSLNMSGSEKNENGEIVW